MNKRRVAIIATHPIQYQIPWFQALSKSDDFRFKVFFAFVPDAMEQGVGFGVKFNWDIPMFDGYDWEVLPNLRKRPSLNGFMGSVLSSTGKIFRNYPSVSTKRLSFTRNGQVRYELKTPWRNGTR